MSEPVFSPLAVQDLEQILEHIARDDRAVAVRFVETLKDKCGALARFPLLGARRDQLAEGLRAFAVGSYVIYYRPERNAARIERVIHGARDIEALFD